jgi:hypothetical protein
LTLIDVLEHALNLAKKAQTDRSTAAAQTAMAAEGYLPHGKFTLHCGEHSTDFDGNPTMHVICACGRGYAFGQRAESVTLLRWLADHDSDPRGATDGGD